MSQTTAQLISNLVQALAFESTSSAPDNGVYLSAANTLSLSTNGIDRITAGTSELVINESGASVDFRVEGDTNANLLFIDASTDRIGVGTSSPGAKLEVKGGDLLVNNVGSGRIFIQDTDATDDVFALKVNGGIFSVQDSNDSLGFVADIFKIYEGAPESSLVISSSGNVGVGTTSPSEKLTVNGSIDLPTINTWIKGGGHNVLQVDATKTYFYGGTGGIQLRTADNLSELVNITNAGFVGIGTSTPGHTLSVVKSTGGDVISFTNGAASNKTGFLYSDSQFVGLMSVGGAGNNQGILFDLVNNRTLIQKVGGTVAAFNATGVGIGTTSPSYNLQIKANTPRLAFQPTADTQENQILFRNAADNATPGAIIYDHNSDYFQINVNSAERARIDSSGRLLVGTSTAPTATQVTDARLVVEGNVGGNPTGGAILTLARGSAITTSGQFAGEILFADTGAGYYGRIASECDGTPGTGDYPGRLVFSTTADGASSPSERMRIESTGVMRHYSPTGGLTCGVSANGSSNSHMLFQGRHSATNVSNGTECFIVFNSGNVQNTNNAYGALSDIKLKENIVNASSQWDDLKAIQVRNYNFKKETGQQTHTQLGVVAQEIELVSPGLVTESPDRDEEGNDLGTTTKSVNYSVLYMKAVKALQEAMERIETLEAKVSALETN